MGLFDFWKRPETSRTDGGDTSKSSNTSGAPAQADTYVPQVTLSCTPDNKLTTIDCADFMIQIPFRWDQVSNEGALEFHNPLLKEQLIITARRTREPLNATQRQVLIDHIVEAYKDGLQRSTTPTPQISPVDQVHRAGESEARFYAKAPSMLMAFGVRYCPGRVLTFSIYRYTDQNFGLPFGTYAGSILDLLKVKT